MLSACLNLHLRRCRSQLASHLNRRRQISFTCHRLVHDPLVYKSDVMGQVRMEETSALCWQSKWWGPLCLSRWLPLAESRCNPRSRPSGKSPLSPGRCTRWESCCMLRNVTVTKLLLWKVTMTDRSIWANLVGDQQSKVQILYKCVLDYVFYIFN